MERLRQVYGEFQKRHEFKPGVVVRWKTGMKNKKFPRDDHPALVMEVLKTPLTDETKDAGSTYFREPLDIVLGIIHPDGDFLTFYFDSRRFEPWE
jgi:hypothetical protein